MKYLDYGGLILSYLSCPHKSYLCLGIRESAKHSHQDKYQLIS